MQGTPTHMHSKRQCTWSEMEEILKIGNVSKRILPWELNKQSHIASEHDLHTWKASHAFGTGKKSPLFLGECSKVHQRRTATSVSPLSFYHGRLSPLTKSGAFRRDTHWVVGDARAICLVSLIIPINAGDQWRGVERTEVITAPSPSHPKISPFSLTFGFQNRFLNCT